MDIPPFKHNYLKWLFLLAVQGKLPAERGAAQLLDIVHEEWCLCLGGGNCDCDPDVVLTDRDDPSKSVLLYAGRPTRDEIDCDSTTLERWPRVDNPNT